MEPDLCRRPGFLQPLEPVAPCILSGMSLPRPNHGLWLGFLAKAAAELIPRAPCASEPNMGGWGEVTHPLGVSGNFPQLPANAPGEQAGREGSVPRSQASSLQQEEQLPGL